VPATGKEGGTNSTEADRRVPGGGFQENMLLSFYNWPKVETSAVFSASVHKNTI